jgi:hypothetical protein
VRDEDPATFARIFAALQPKQLEITDEDPISNLTQTSSLRLIASSWNAKSQNVPHAPPRCPSSPQARSG